MFTRFYLGLFLSAVVVIALNYGIFKVSYDVRHLDYSERTLKPILDLLVHQAGTIPSEKREAYLRLAAEIMGSELVLKSEDKTLSEKQKLSASHELLANTGEEIRWRVTFREDKKSLEVYEYRFVEVDEQIFRAHAILLAAVQDKDVLQLSSFAGHHSLRLLEDIPTSLDSQQRSRLSNGSAVVVYQADTPQFTVFINKGEEGVLSLGPIEEFEYLPRFLAVVMMLTTVFLVTAVAYVFISRLERRIENLSRVVSDYGKGNLEARVEVEGKDHLSHVSSQFNSMANRISLLLTGQREMMQAVSHELRTPLARMRFRLAVLDEAREGNLIKEQLTGLNEDVTDIDHLTKEILEFHKLAQTAEVQLASINLNQMIERVVVNSRLVHDEVAIDVFMDDDLLLHSEPKSIERALINLLENACKYGAGKIIVTVNQDNSNTTISVEDNGPGIPMHMRDKVLLPFQRGGPEQTKRGYGLGLSIVQKVAELHKGHFAVGDSAQGGASFQLTIPQHTAT